tara:strand:+ start:1530 stop:2318 length:789 start_codon:yes stop_codon:yes gene_type:complete
MITKVPIYQIDAFSNGPFTGNPAAVCPLEKWLPEDVLQSIAEENNLAETAFFVNESDGFRIRWFTPTTEVKLCGHATLATGFVLFNELGYNQQTINFNCLSGSISVTKSNDLLTLDFPIDNLSPCDCPERLIKSLDTSPMSCYKGASDYLLIFENQKDIERLSPNFGMMSEVKSRGCIVSAKGEDFDVVCRGFFPQSGINEDPATGSAQTTLASYWKDHLSENKFSSCQLSKRKGFFNTEIKGNRVLISGKCRMYMRGKLEV